MDKSNDRVKFPESIGLSLSGGGFRAAAFHLGSMAYLNRVGLLSRVSMLSTVSGGTITGSMYALSLAKKQPFRVFIKCFYQELEKQHDPSFEPLIKIGLKHLGSGLPTDTPSGRRNLITSMAQTYCETLFYDYANKRSYQFKDLLGSDTSPLNEITFNATDFRTGIAFRFQKSEFGWIGNRYSNLSPELAGELRLGDIVAASSCFPGGFEPMEFPVDFGWPGNKLPEEIRAQFEGKSIGMMDGGVYDNQGIDSLLLADNRTDPKQSVNKEATQKVDLFIISDTDRTSENLFPFPAPVRNSSLFLLRVLLRFNPSLRVINASFRGLQFLCIATAVMISIQAIGSDLSWKSTDVLWGTLAYGFPLLLSLSTFVLLWLIRHQFRWAILPQIPVVGFAGWGDLKRIRLDQLIDMLNLRGRSLLALASNVFMKRIRQLGYRIVYGDERYARRLIANYVYHLKSPNWFFQSSPDLQKLSPKLQKMLAQIPSIHTSPKLKEVVRLAEAMQTTLWFNDRSELPSIVVAGQATICFNLMKHIVRTYRFDDETEKFPEDVQALWRMLNNDWQKFIMEPAQLLNEELERYTVGLTSKPN